MIALRATWRPPSSKRPATPPRPRRSQARRSNRPARSSNLLDERLSLGAVWLSIGAALRPGWLVPRTHSRPAHRPHICGVMRDIFEDIFATEPVEAVEAARRAMRPQLRRRFYQTVCVGETDAGFEVRLDERSARTPGGRTLAA